MRSPPGALDDRGHGRVVGRERRREGELPHVAEDRRLVAIEAHHPGGGGVEQARYAGGGEASQSSLIFLPGGAGRGNLAQRSFQARLELERGEVLVGRDVSDQHSGRVIGGGGGHDGVEQAPVRVADGELELAGAGLLDVMPAGFAALPLALGPVRIRPVRANKL